MSRGLSAFDLTQNFVANYHYRLPVGQVWRGGPKALTGGWEVFGLTRLTTGFPVTLVNNNDSSLLGTQPNGVNNVGADELNVAAGPLELKGTPRAGAGFNAALFSVPALGEFRGCAAAVLPRAGLGRHGLCAGEVDDGAGWERAAGAGGGV